MLRLVEQMEAHPEFAAIGGLYFTKGPGGCAQIWGDPKDPVVNYRPQLPDPNGGLVECCGTGMGFTMYRLSMFKDPRLRKPWRAESRSGRSSSAFLKSAIAPALSRSHILAWPRLLHENASLGSYCSALS